MNERIPLWSLETVPMPKTHRDLIPLGRKVEAYWRRARPRW
jgi:hypothetical protein